LGARIVLGDRPIEITLKRTWASLSTWEKLKLGYVLLTESWSEITEEDVERIKNSDVITELVKELGQHFPSLMEPIIAERDRFLAYGLRRCPGNVIVGVVGMGHCAGIVRHWEDDIDINALLTVPPPVSWRGFVVKTLLLLFPCLLGLVYLLYLMLHSLLF